ncbi:twin-arginine translocation protein, TatA/E family subunit [Chloroherpeton thalassium ATCC 35110]|uniref:Sec-independent protein translocase protein TatA n=1 Tax=Chloroherpeton thalassium (strain ATCC 35110 / GB-78) TaxID=517418 RepID=B3QU00_CHLT3|nr:twin-arginine translocase TatA/TatE family subunit [Chloroherpeton thalassium]ACF12798.1 twin-arginine translocation protein, TatA/E family subunit [Chloroherpeton thalassium ATCC 35110]
MFGLGGQELIVILLIILLFFGAKKLPELAKGLGKGLNEFKKAQAGLEEEFNKAVEAPKTGSDDLSERVKNMSDDEKAKLAAMLNASKK